MNGIVPLLRQCGFFAATDEETLRLLAAHAVTVPLAAGECLFRQGEPGTAMYVVLDGRVRVHVGDEVVASLGSGEFLGEIAALSNAHRTAAATAEQDSALLKLEQDSLFAVLSERPQASRSVIQALCRRETQLIDEKYERIVRAKVLENELEIGQRIQRSFLPERTPEVEGWQLGGLLRPARKVAGDFYDFFPLPALRAVALLIGDVCDKGVGAALFMSLFRSLIRSDTLNRGAIAAGGGGPDVLADLALHAIDSTNRYVASTHGGSSMFSSAFLGLVAVDSGQLRYVNAGHEAPWIIGADGACRALPPTGPVIGLFESASFAVGGAQIGPRDQLFAYTDGVSDARDRLGEPFGEGRLFDLVRSAAASRGDMLDEVDACVRRFVGDAEQYDDITMISARREPAS